MGRSAAPAAERAGRCVKCRPGTQQGALGCDSRFWARLRGWSERRPGLGCPGEVPAVELSRGKKAVRNLLWRGQRNGGLGELGGVGSRGGPLALEAYRGETR